MALPHLLARGVRLETHEAVALAQELIAHQCGRPTPENIRLRSDGAARCLDTAGTPSIEDIARLLTTLLPDGTPDVPAALRYAIARGLDAVEAPAFASLDEFSRALERFEKGVRRDVLSEVVQRGARRTRPIAVAPAAVRPAQEPPVEAPPMFGAFASGAEAVSPGRPSILKALAIAAALVMSFAMGFAVADRFTARPATTQPQGSAPVPPSVSNAASTAHAARPNGGAVELRTEIVRIPGISPAGRERVQPAATTGAGAVADGRSGPAFSPAVGSASTAIFLDAGRDREAGSAIEAATSGTGPHADLGIMTIVDDGSHNYHPQPSPDGRMVAFDSDRDGERGIYIAHRDGTQVRRVSGPGHAAVPRWSRSGEWLAYIRPEADAPSVWNLWVQPATGGSARRVTNYRDGQTWAASWFPDDRRIAYSHDDSLMVVDLQTNESTRYHTPVKGAPVRTPAVSPDGSKIIFQVSQQGAWLLDVADGSMRRVLTDPTAEDFAWSPDGRRIAFHSRRDGQWSIYVLLGG